MGRDSVNALARTFSLLATGSTFFHASQTRLGGLIDDNPVALLANLAHQAAMEFLPYNPITHELLRNGTRNYRDVEAVIESSRVFLEESV
jgi:hypothetical protein